VINFSFQPTQDVACLLERSLKRVPSSWATTCTESGEAFFSHVDLSAGEAYQRNRLTLHRVLYCDREEKALDYSSLHQKVGPGFSFYIILLSPLIRYPPVPLHPEGSISSIFLFMRLKGFPLPYGWLERQSHTLERTIFPLMDPYNCNDHSLTCDIVFDLSALRKTSYLIKRDVDVREFREPPK